MSKKVKIFVIAGVIILVAVVATVLGVTLGAVDKASLEGYFVYNEGETVELDQGDTLQVVYYVHKDFSGSAFFVDYEVYFVVDNTIIELSDFNVNGVDIGDPEDASYAGVIISSSSELDEITFTMTAVGSGTAKVCAEDIENQTNGKKVEINMTNKSFNVEVGEKAMFDNVDFDFGTTQVVVGQELTLTLTIERAFSSGTYTVFLKYDKALSLSGVTSSASCSLSCGEIDTTDDTTNSVTIEVTIVSSTCDKLYITLKGEMVAESANVNADASVNGDIVSYGTACDIDVTSA